MCHNLLIIWYLVYCQLRPNCLFMVVFDWPILFRHSSLPINRGCSAFGRILTFPTPVPIFHELLFLRLKGSPHSQFNCRLRTVRKALFWCFIDVLLSFIMALWLERTCFVKQRKISSGLNVSRKSRTTILQYWRFPRAWFSMGIFRTLQFPTVLVESH